MLIILLKYYACWNSNLSWIDCFLNLIYFLSLCLTFFATLSFSLTFPVLFSESICKNTIRSSKLFTLCATHFKILHQKMMKYILCSQFFVHPCTLDTCLISRKGETPTLLAHYKYNKLHGYTPNCMLLVLNITLFCTSKFPPICACLLRDF